MKTIEDIRNLLGLGVLSVIKHGEAPTAQAVTEFRQTLLADVKAISESGSAELIVAMEKALVQHDLEYYANSKTMIGSLNTALPAAGRWTRPGRRSKATMRGWSIWIRRLPEQTGRSMICKKSSLRRANQAFIGRSSNT